MSEVEQAVAEFLVNEGLLNKSEAIYNLRVARILLAALAERGYHVTRSEGLDVERLAEAWANVMDGRRIGSGLDAPRIGRETTTAEDWHNIAREYGGTRSDREARLEAALMEMDPDFWPNDETHRWCDEDSGGNHRFDRLAWAQDFAVNLRRLLSEAPE